ncbi:hypothetical protein EG831_00090 [bacterium]|nr:hypothetical protein [bacterium]
MDKEKDQYQALLMAIDECLRQWWDPIGIKDDLAARGEYSGHASSIYTLLQRSCTASELAQHLDSIVTTQMGLPSNPPRELDVARKLLTLRPPDALDSPH